MEGAESRNLHGVVFYADIPTTKEVPGNVGGKRAAGKTNFDDMKISVKGATATNIEAFL